MSTALEPNIIQTLTGRVLNQDTGTTISPVVQSMSLPEKQDKAYGMILQGAPRNAVSEFFGICGRTLRRWLAEATKRHREDLQSQSALDTVTDTLLTFEQLEGVLLEEVTNLRTGGVSVDPATGAITKDKTITDTRNSDAVIRAIQTVADIRMKRHKVLHDVGALPKANNGNNTVDWQGNITEVQEKETPDREKTAEELQADIDELLRNSRRITVSDKYDG